MAEERIVLLGIGLVFIGFLVTVIGSLLGEEGSSVKVGIGGFIGPVPFGFANDPRLLGAVLIISVLALVLFLFR